MKKTGKFNSKNAEPQKVSVILMSNLFGKYMGLQLI